MSLNNPHIRALLQDVKGIGTDVVVSWAEIESRRDLPNLDFLAQEVRRRAADRITHKIVGDVAFGGAFRGRHEPEGMTYSLRGYWLTYEQLVDLMQRAYDKGRLESPRISAGLPMTTPISTGDMPL